MFSSKSFIVSAFMFRSLVYFQLVFVYYIKGPTSFVCMWILSFLSTWCWEDCPFYIEWSWHPFQKSMQKSISGLSVWFHWSVWLCLCQYHTLWLLQLCSKFWNQKMWDLQLYFSSSRLFFFFKIWVPLRVCVNFRMGFSISKKKYCKDFDRGWIECIDCFG